MSHYPNTNIGRVRQFFLANPDESLTYSDISVKFDLSIDQAKNAVHELVREGFAKVDHIVLVTAKEQA